MTELPDHGESRAGSDRYLSRLVRLLRETDRNETVLKFVTAARRVAPGGDQLSTAAPGSRRASDRLARLVAQAGAEPSAMRELGLAAIQVWQALARPRRGGRTDTEITILFTDLVGFSTWALEVGDDPVLRLLREVGRVSEAAVTRYGGTVVKSLGDGLMAAFPDAESAITAAHEACIAVNAVTVDGYRPQLRAGLHSGRPHRVGHDYLGVDVNIAARVADAAAAGQVLVSGPALETVDTDRYTVRRRRGFRAPGAPKDLEVYSVVPRYQDSPEKRRTRPPVR
ncbi:adenylate/guanylate cyclase domain-containing protein [Amycolatopsis anabasis]|uniref:adenylate/guanylate cyclase domain-containing protein n=1 Tax=Amycolatopsis anabasis TaxID=1840409 RepID=UPI001FE38E61|nr:adenylate/guanylate cyclase domain-containing protein [Amycolatopsis anabasis]